MNKKKIGLMLLSWLVMVSAFAQIPNMLRKGKADSQECKDWVESRLEKMTLKGIMLVMLLKKSVASVCLVECWLLVTLRHWPSLNLTPRGIILT